MVRVGGGYVYIEEFVVKYQSGEIVRLKVATHSTGMSLKEVIAKLSKQKNFK